MKFHIFVSELPFNLTLDNRMSVFQFKINHNILYTKNRLLIIKISERSFTQRFDDSMSSFSSEKRIKFTT